MESYIVRIEENFKHQKLSEEIDVEWDTLSSEIWSTPQGVIHRENGPAIIFRDKESGKQAGELWYSHGKLHRDGGPAVCIEYGDGKYILREWHRNGEYHREDGPARTHEEMMKSGWALGSEHWYRAGKSHRIGGPATAYCELFSGVITNESWCQDGELHRLEHRAVKLIHSLL